MADSSTSGPSDFLSLPRLPRLAQNVNDIQLTTMSGTTTGQPRSSSVSSAIRARQSTSSIRSTGGVGEASGSGGGTGEIGVGKKEASEAPNLIAVISREAGEKDPLLLREKIIGEGELEQLKKWVH